MLTFTSSWQVVDDAWLTDSMMVLFNASMSLGGSGKHAFCKSSMYCFWLSGVFSLLTEMEFLFCSRYCLSSYNVYISLARFKDKLQINLLARGSFRS